MLIYSLSVAFSVLTERSGIIENQSMYAVVEYVATKMDGAPVLGSGVRIMPGGRLQFIVSGNLNAYVRFVFLRHNDANSRIVVTENASVADGGKVDVTVNCGKCHCGADDDQVSNGLRLIVSDVMPVGANVVWGDQDDTVTAANPLDNSDVRNLDAIVNLSIVAGKENWIEENEIL